MERKHGAVLAIAVFALLASPALRAQPRESAAPRAPAVTSEAADWRSPDAWRRLRVGMSQAEVVRILGDPGRVTHYYGFSRWEYPDALGRRVNFDDRGRLLAWGDLAR
jgi:outer membrane protein assembly factor BamE (lipoprotein component of BamABCDE complex)